MAERDNKKQRQQWQERKPREILVLNLVEKSEKEVKVQADLLNSHEERRVRFSFDGFVDKDNVKPTAEKKAEHTFPVPKGTISARIRVELVENRSVSDEITVSIPTTTTLSKEVKKEQQMKIDILGPNAEKDFFISIRTPEPKKEVTLSSNVRLNIVFADPPMEDRKGTFFDLETSDEGNLYMRIGFEETKAVCVFRYIPTGEIHKRMLIK